MVSFSLFERPLRTRLEGIGAITGAVFLLSLSDALVSLNSGSFALGQVLAVRSFFAAIILAAASGGWVAFLGSITSSGPWIWARSFCLALMWGCYYAGLPSMPFSLAAACYYTAPMWMAALSAVLTGYRIDFRGGASIALGLAGVVAILRPGIGAVSPLVALPLLAAFFYALAAVITAVKCRQASPMAIALNLNIVLAASGLVYVLVLVAAGAGSEAGFVFSAWPRLTKSAWGLLLGLGVLLAIITAAVACAYQRAPAPVIGLFDNSYLVFAVLWGLLLFGEMPDGVDLTGIMLIGAGAILASFAAPAAGREEEEKN